MGKAKRRRAAETANRTPSAQAAEQNYRAIRDEGSGVYQLAWFAPDDMPRLAGGALGGTRQAQDRALVYFREIVRVLQVMERGGPGVPQCLLCGHTFIGDDLALIGFLHAVRDDPVHAVAHVLCTKCRRRYPTNAELERAVAEFYRANMISDLRVLPPLSEPGHACPPIAAAYQQPLPPWSLNRD